MSDIDHPDRSVGDGRSLLDRPALDWLVVGLVAVLVIFPTPLVDLWIATGTEGQRAAMSSTASVLGTIAGFAVAALFFYGALDNPSTRYVRSQWGGQLANAFLRALGVIFLSAVVCGFTAVSVPHRAGAIVFLIATLAGFAKLARLVLIVAALLHGQRHDSRPRPATRLRRTG